MIAQQWRDEIAPVNPASAAEARTRIDNLTKPVGSLGRVEDLAVQLCAIAGGVPTHAYQRRAIIIGAGDHGVAEAGVSAYPAEVTAQMVAGFLAETAAISAFARAVRADVYVANFGVRTPLDPHPRLLDVHCGYATANLARRAAIPRDDLGYVLAAGVAAFDEVMERAPFDILALGEMGIANTTSAAAIVAAFTGKPVPSVVGRGTGIDDERFAHKVNVVERALARIQDFTWEQIASEVGGYEIVGLAGMILAAARARIPIVLDGFIVSAAALIAGAIAPHALDYCIAAHRSREPGHALALAALGMRPLFELDLALGEATGAALALPLIEASARMVREMRTFEEAGVATKEPER
ncbi:MAG TPA: nicotinate-nucleotide--dimethylbenzimidazole phosphoribosyltransferase [Candidatus Elarobacter sp.]|jgi:nicotinate-nucleotide--dimethylbenzimidazole phosphoribosyltransferase|nr:nicotinate-nucleotide--dimethylbenzimidazole phosphoribosyltransferase [Candidatus Elarobacter sp.]